MSGDAPAHVIAEDERVLVFLDLFPVAEGHTLVVPKAHAPDLFAADEEDLRAVITRSHAVAHALRRLLRPDGLGVYQLNGAAAGQTVFHYHMHLIPRQDGEGLRIHGRERGDAARLAETARKLREALGGG